MAKTYHEWLLQADYDFETAENLFECGRFFYAIFLCHLSIEKALKAIYLQQLKKEPPKTHSLLFLVETAGLEMPEEVGRTVFLLNRVSVPTRYPDELQKMLKEYDKNSTRNLLDQSWKVLKWLKRKS